MTDIDGDFIRKLRWELGWSQRELAKKLGVTPGSVGQWESSMTKPGRQNQERLKDIASEANQTIEDAWKERIIGFRLSRDSDKYSIEVGERVTRVTPFIKISMNALTPILIPSVKGELVVNPGYQSSLKFFRNKVESSGLVHDKDYEFGAVEHDIFLTPLHESAWQKLKPWKLSDKELIGLWNNRTTA